MKNKEEEKLSRKVPAESAASLFEVEQAINSLTDKDFHKLAQYAKWRIIAIGYKSSGRNFEDLLYEAISATLNSRRTWNKDHGNFVNYLIGTIRSISNNWSRCFNDNEPILESDFISNTMEGQDKRDCSNLYAIPAIQEEELLARQHEEAITRLFEDDPLITLIICELKEGLKLIDIRNKYNIQGNDFEAAIKRLRRKLARFYQG
jgi:hypothetical protein